MLQHFLMDDSLSNNSSSSLVQLVAAQVFLSTGEMTREALQCVYLGTTMEHLALVIQIYLKMDRVDLAMDTLELMRQADEEAILTHLSSCRCKMTLGRSKIQEVIHSLSTLMEQYGPSPLLLNMIGSAYLIAGSYDQAEKILEEAAKVEEESVGIPSVDTLINTICCMQHLGKIGNRHGVVEKLKSWYAEHSFVQGLIRMETAFEREAIKYKVSA
jgi:coatomer protein complex subunit epsilon